MNSREQKIHKRDDCLLRQEKSWHRARIGAICLAIFSGISLFVVKNQHLGSDKKEVILIMTVWFLFWGLIVSYCNLKINHIDSIKLYRHNQCESE